MANTDVQTQIGGKWKLERSENFDEFLKEIGELCFIYYYFLLLSLFHIYLVVSYFEVMLLIMQLPQHKKILQNIL